MKKLGIAVMMVLLVSMLFGMAGCGGGGSAGAGGTGNDNTNSHSISGQVTLNGSPLSGVTVSPGTGSSATTDTTGNYTIVGLVNGSYTVTATKTGYNISSSQTVTINSSNVSGVNFTATAIAVPTYSISGKVTTSGLYPISGVTVIAGGVSATTDTNGNYTIAGLINGSYAVSAQLFGSTSFSPSPGRAVTVNGSDVSGVNFTANNPTPTYSISGQVTLNGSPLSGVTVSPGAGYSVATDTNGSYTMVGLVNGSYTVTATKTGYNISSSQTVTINSSNVSGVNFTATAIAVPTYSISGKVTLNNSPLSGATVSVGTGSSVTTDINGNYTFVGLVNGSYTVTATKTGYNISSSQTVTVNGSNVSGVNFTATASYSISGGVYLDQFVPQLVGATVTVVPDFYSSTPGVGTYSAITNSIGQYTISGVPNGNYRVTAAKTGYTISGVMPVAVNGANVTGINFLAY